MCFARNFDKSVVCPLKSSDDDNERKSAFQTTATELSKQTNTKKKTKKEHLTLVTNSIRVGVVFMCTRTIDFRLASVFLKDLKHLSYTT